MKKQQKQPGYSVDIERILIYTIRKWSPERIPGIKWLGCVASVLR